MWAWGAVVACLVCRHFFLLPSGQAFDNQEGISYLLRSVEFRDLLRNGHWSPQWCVDFRGGLGGPFFGYYQPGYFYAESLAPGFLEPFRRAGFVALVFSWLGYLGAAQLIGRRYGPWHGALAGTLLLAVRYASTNLYVRADYSEYCAWMMFVVALDRLDAWSAEHSRRRFALAALASAALVLLHPAIALVGFGFLAGWIGLRAAFTRDRRAFAGGLAILASGAAGSAFYWLPVLAELSWSSADRAMLDHYHYSRHFVTLWEMLGPRPTATPISVKLGWSLPFLTLAALAALALRFRSLDREQQILAAGCGILLASSLFLITPASSGIWDQLRLLQRVQFPWRLLTFVSLGAAGIAASWPFRGVATRGLIAAICVAQALTASPFPRHVPVVDANCPSHARQIGRVYFRPDIQDEWLPAGASLETGLERYAAVTEPDVRAGKIELSANRVECRIEAPRATAVTLPHYWFPAGWSASLDGRPLAIERTDTGLIRVQIPAAMSGRLRLEFSSTPWRRRGWIVASLSWLGLAGYLRRYFSNHAKVCATCPMSWLGRAEISCDAPGTRTSAVSTRRNCSA